MQLHAYVQLCRGVRGSGGQFQVGPKLLLLFFVEDHGLNFLSKELVSYCSYW